MTALNKINKLVVGKRGFEPAARPVVALFYKPHGTVTGQSDAVEEAVKQGSQDTGGPEKYMPTSRTVG